MTDIELVIKIPEDEYKRWKEDGEIDAVIVRDALINGTPLEKHDEEVIKETVESIWGKPPYTELLDKIRAEIKQLPYQRIFGKVSSYSLLDAVVEIIDKYRAESEKE